LSTINEDFCGMDVNTPLGGTDPASATASYTWSNTLITSVAAAATSSYTVAFLGTSDGRLKKVRIAFLLP
jgi:plexin A